MICPNCKWEIKARDKFCSGCGESLVKLRIAPLPGEKVVVYKGIDQTIFRFENEGANQILLYQISCEHPLETVPTMQQSNPLVLQQDAIQEVIVKFQSSPEIGERDAFQIRTSAGEASYPYSVDSVPQITVSLGIDDGKLALNEMENIYFHAPGELKIPGEITIDKHNAVLFAVGLFNPTSHLRLHAETQLPHLLTPEEPFKFQIHLPDSEQNDFDCQLTLDFQLLEPRAFPIAFQEHESPKLDFALSAYFIEQDAISSTAKRPREFYLNLGNIGGEVLRIDKVESTADWLHIVDSRQVEDEIIQPNTFADPKVDSSENALKLDLQILPQLIEPPNELQELEGDNEQERQQDETFQAAPTQQEPLPQGFIVTGEKIVVTYSDVATFRSFTEDIPVEIEVREPEPLREPLAIDFGTTNTAVAYIPNRLAAIETVTLDWEADLPDQIASCLRFVKYSKSDLLAHTVDTGQRTYDGRFASLEAMKSTAWGWKRFIGSREDFKLSYIDARGTVKSFTPVELTAIFLKKVIESFEDAHPFKVQKVLLTFPEVFIEVHNRQLIQALENISYSNAETYISEPQALAFEYVYHDKLEIFELEADRDEEQDTGKEGYLGVFDFGGGTTDITIARVKYSKKLDDNVIFPLRSHGDSQLGGDNITFLLARKLYDKILMQQDSDSTEEGAQSEVPFPSSFEDMMKGISTEEQLSNYGILAHEAERIKIDRYAALENSGSVNLVIPAAFTKIIKSENGVQRMPFAPQVEFSMDDFKESVERVIRSGFETLNDIVMSLYEENKIKKDEPQLDVLILGGNSCRLPLVQEIAEEEALADEVIFNPENCKIGVPRGALLSYEYRIREYADDEEIEGVTLFPIGYSRRNRFEVLFERHTAVDPDTPACNEIIFPGGKRRVDELPIYINRDPEFRENEPEDSREARHRRLVFGNPHIEEIARIPIPREKLGRDQFILKICLLGDCLEYSISVSEGDQQYRPIVQGARVPITLSYLQDI